MLRCGLGLGLWVASDPYEWGKAFIFVHHIGMCKLLGLASNVQPRAMPHLNLTVAHVENQIRHCKSEGHLRDSRISYSEVADSGASCQDLDSQETSQEAGFKNLSSPQ